jgi:chaperone required for assembly of F1-ATPase
MLKPRRFYTAVTVEPRDGGFGIALDARPMPSPAKKPFILPTRALAEAIAAEWDAQQGEVKPLSMPQMRLAATAIDRLPDHRAQTVDEAAAHGATDLVCYRAASPAPLVQRQQEAWDPALAWAMRRYDVHLETTTSALAVAQPQATLARLREAVAAHDDFHLAALHALTTASGSLILALAALARELDADALWRCSLADELWQMEQWGTDAEAEARRAALRADLATTLRFVGLLNAAQ